MISLTNVLDDMRKDFTKDAYKTSKVITRQFSGTSGSRIDINLYKSDDACEISIMLPADVEKDDLKKIPSWKGMETRFLPATDSFIAFKQVGEYDRRIFLLVMQDVIDVAEHADLTMTVEAVSKVLAKWSAFFKRDDLTTLSMIEQQGLYGELVILENLLKHRGDVISCWTGCEKETHDFYIDNNAIEVKTSSKSGPDIVKVSNEYQLDDSDVEGNLYLAFLKIKRSEADGEKLPVIVDRVYQRLSDDQAILFEEKLLKSGYILKMPDLYTYAFRVRNERYFEIKMGFPRIVSSDLDKGIGAVGYELSLDACSNYEISTDLYLKGVNA